MMRRWLACVLLAAASAGAQMQMPPGTRSVDEHAEQTPSSSNPALVKAEGALAAGNYDAAVTLLKPLALDTEKNGRVFYDLGFAQDALGHDTEAVTAYKAAIARDTNDAASRVSLGLLLARGGDHAGAEEQLRAAAKLTSGDPALVARADRALAEIDLPAKPEQAREDLIAALKLTPETPQDALLAAQIADAMDDSAATLQAYAHAAKLAPADPEAAVGYARELARQKRYTDAEAALQPALKTHPQSHAILAELASEKLLSGHIDEAMPMLARLRQAEPDNLAVAELEARAYAANGHADKAEELYNDLLAKHPENAMLLAEAGDNLIRDKRGAEAEPLLLKAMQHPEQFRTRLDLANTAAELAFAASAAHHPETVLKALATRETVMPSDAPFTFLSATAHDSLHHTRDAIAQYHLFLQQSGGKFPDQEWQAKQRLQILERSR